MRDKMIELMELSERLEEKGLNLAFSKTANNNLVLEVSSKGQIVLREYVYLTFDDMAEYKYHVFINNANNLMKGF